MYCVTDSLLLIQLIPKKEDGSNIVKGGPLLDHMIMFCKRAGRSGKEEVYPPLGLGVTPDQQCILNPLVYDITCGAIMQDAGGKGATTKIAKWRLDNLGYIKAHLGWQIVKST